MYDFCAFFESFTQCCALVQAEPPLLLDGDEAAYAKRLSKLSIDDDKVGGSACVYA